MATVDQKAGLPISILLASASPHEVTLVEKTLDESFVDVDPMQIIGDKAYDSDDLDDILFCERGIELVSPERKNKKTHRQTEEDLVDYKNRWKVERFLAWIQNWRRITTRWDYYAENYLGFIQLACVVMLVKRL